jgi:hypothetical protein
VVWHRIFLGGAAKDMEMMTYALVRRNPMVTKSVPKFRPEVHTVMAPAKKSAIKALG